MPRSMPRRDALTPLARCPGVALADSLIAAEAMPGQWHDQVVDSVEADYRPVSLTSSLRKVIEKMVSLRLPWFLEDRGICTKSQFGFMKH